MKILLDTLGAVSQSKAMIYCSICPYLPLSSPDLVSGGKDSKSLIIGAIFQTRARVGRWKYLQKIMLVAAMPEAEISI